MKKIREVKVCVKGKKTYSFLKVYKNRKNELDKLFPARNLNKG